MKNLICRCHKYWATVHNPETNYWRTALFLMVLLSARGLRAQNPFITTWKTNNPGTSGSKSITIPTHPADTYLYDVDWNNDGTYDELGITGSVTHTYGTAGTYTIRIRGAFPRIEFSNGGDRLKILSVNQWGDIVWGGMANAFYGCANLHVTATDSPNLSMVNSMANLFREAAVFNENINTWNVANVNDMQGVFWGASSFNQPLAGWDVSQVTNMYQMFSEASAFNQPVGGWNTGNLGNTANMFSGAVSFNQPLAGWDVSQVSAMSSMFSGAAAFNQPIGGWDVGNVLSMHSMFSGATSFNQDISGWEVGQVTNMDYMFSGATSFDQPIGGWDVSQVTTMIRMFSGATSFDQPLGDWNVANVGDMYSMFTDVELSAANYDDLLIGWSALALQPDVNFGAGTSMYTCAAVAARALMTDINGLSWNIIDGGFLGAYSDYYYDGDGDGYGAGAPVNYCMPPSADYVSTTGDCNDTDPNVNPSPDCSTITRTWTGYTSNDWFTDCNWSPNCVPAAANDVVIPNTANDPVIPAAASVFARSIRIESGALLDLQTNATLQISGSAGIGIENQGELNNDGVITVDNTASYGIYNRNGGVITCYPGSLLNVGNNGGNIGSDGIYNHINAIFSNGGGEIRVDNCTGRGIHNQSAAFTNQASGIIRVGMSGGNIGSNGVVNRGTGGVFTNNASAIYVDHAANRGISNEIVFNNQNGGEIHIGPNNSSTELYNTSVGTITNTGCASFLVEGTMINIGSTVNDGYFYFNTNQAHGNGSTFTNNGVMVFAQLPVMANIVNNDVIIPPLTLDCTTGISLSNALQLGGSNSFTILSEWFKDEGLTDKAGDYNQGANTFTATDLPAGTQPLYFTATGGGCAFNVFATVTAAVAMGGAGKTWTGLAGSDWDDPCNWMPFVVPSAAENVTIPNVANHPVIGGTSNAMAQSVTVLSDAQLDIAPGGSLTIDGSAGAGFSNNGIFTNNGALYIDNIADYGVHNFSGSVFTNNGNLHIGQNGGSDNIHITGLFNQGTFDNHGLLSIDNTGFSGILNQGTVNNYGTVGLGQNGGPGNISDISIDNSGVINNIAGEVLIDEAFSGIFSSDGGSVVNYADIKIGDSGAVTNGGVVVIAGGSFENKPGGFLSVDNTGFNAVYVYNSFTNDGLVQIGANGPVTGDGFFGNQSGSQLLNSGSGAISIDQVSGHGIEFTAGNFQNDGQLTIGGTLGIGQDGIHNSTAMANTGTIAITGTSGLACWSQTGLDNTGILKGVGTFDLNAIPLGGAFAPGNSPGKAVFVDNQSFPATNTLEIEVNGTTPETQYDVVEVNGTATLGGTLNASISYTPAANDRIVFLTASAVSGTFGNVSPALPANWSLDYSVPGEVALVFNGILPVELVGFSVVKKRESVELTWQTASETNNSGFEIEHSTDGRNWNVLGFVTGRGTATDRYAYRFMHENPACGINYYRLRQIDFDGRAEYSAIRSVTLDNAPGSVKIFPNPASKQITVQFPADTDHAVLTITDAQGRGVFEEKDLGQGADYRLDLAAFPSGLYFIRIRNNGIVSTQKLQINRD